MRRLLLVANPAASGFTASLHRSVTASLRRGYAVTTVWPDSASDAELVAANAAAEGFDVVVAMGGDGAVHRIANGIVGTDTALGVIPAGTTNVFARLVGFPKSGDAAAEAIANSRRTRFVPSLEFTTAGSGATTARTAIFAGGVGFDADVVAEAERSPLGKVGFGSLHYARSTLRTVPKYRGRKPNLRVAVDGERFNAVTVLAQAHNRYTFMGRRSLTLSPDGGPAVMAIRSVRPIKLARVIARTARHRPLSGIPGVRVWHPFTVVTVDADPMVAFEVDGEPLGEISQMTMTVRRDALLIVDPQAG